MVAMATLPMHIWSTSKFIAITLIRTANNEANGEGSQTTRIGLVNQGKNQSE